MHGREKAGAVCRCQWSSPSTQPGHTSNVSFTILSEPVRAWSKISLISPAGLFSKKLLFAVTQRFVIIHEVKCSRERLLGAFLFIACLATRRIICFGCLSVRMPV